MRRTESTKAILPVWSGAGATCCSSSAGPYVRSLGECVLLGPTVFQQTREKLGRTSLSEQPASHYVLFSSWHHACVSILHHCVSWTSLSCHCRWCNRNIVSVSVFSTIAPLCITLPCGPCFVANENTAACYFAAPFNKFLVSFPQSGSTLISVNTCRFIVLLAGSRAGTGRTYLARKARHLKHASVTFTTCLPQRIHCFVWGLCYVTFTYPRNVSP